MILKFKKEKKKKKLSYGEQVLDYALSPSPTPIFNSREMQLEEDNRGYFEDESKMGLLLLLLGGEVWRDFTKFISRP